MKNANIQSKGGGWVHKIFFVDTNAPPPSPPSPISPDRLKYRSYDEINY